MTVKELERRMQSLLLTFEEETGHKIDFVEVDTRNFANLAVSVVLTQPRVTYGGRDILDAERE